MKIAIMMVIDKFEKLNNDSCNKKNARDNLCLHAGFTPVSSTDKLTVPGLSIPRQLIQCKLYGYLSLVEDKKRDGDCRNDEKDEEDSCREGGKDDGGAAGAGNMKKTKRMTLAGKKKKVKFTTQAVMERKKMRRTMTSLAGNMKKMKRTT